MMNLYQQSIENNARTDLRADAVGPQWYAVWTRSRHEKSVSENLQRKNIETFLPVYSSVRRWKNGDHQVSLPLFPGYTFVRIGFADRLRAVKVPGVVRLVGFNSTPVPVPEEQIEMLRNALGQGMRAEPHPYLTVGQRVRITAGPLVGQQGVLIRRKGAWRVVLSIELIQRSILVDAYASAIEPVT